MKHGMKKSTVIHNRVRRQLYKCKLFYESSTDHDNIEVINLQSSGLFKKAPVCMYSPFEGVFDHFLTCEFSALRYKKDVRK